MLIVIFQEIRGSRGLNSVGQFAFNSFIPTGFRLCLTQTMAYQYHKHDGLTSDPNEQQTAPQSLGIDPACIQLQPSAPPVYELNDQVIMYAYNKKVNCLFSKNVTL